MQNFEFKMRSKIKYLLKIRKETTVTHFYKITKTKNLTKFRKRSITH